MGILTALTKVPTAFHRQVDECEAVLLQGNMSWTSVVRALTRACSCDFGAVNVGATVPLVHSGLEMISKVLSMGKSLRRYVQCDALGHWFDRRHNVSIRRSRTEKTLPPCNSSVMKTTCQEVSR